MSIIALKKNCSHHQKFSFFHSSFPITSWPSQQLLKSVMDAVTSFVQKFRHPPHIMVKCWCTAQSLPTPITIPTLCILPVAKKPCFWEPCTNLPSYLIVTWWRIKGNVEKTQTIPIVHSALITRLFHITILQKMWAPTKRKKHCTWLKVN